MSASRRFDAGSILNGWIIGNGCHAVQFSEKSCVIELLLIEYQLCLLMHTYVARLLETTTYMEMEDNNQGCCCDAVTARNAGCLIV